MGRVYYVEYMTQVGRGHYASRGGAIESLACTRVEVDEILVELD